MNPLETRRLYLAVGIGTAIGSLLRFAVALATAGLGLPGLAATGFVNIVGSFIIVFVATIAGPGGRLQLAPVPRQFVVSGFCGGFTTFSSMSLDGYLLMADARPVAAATYLISSVLLSLTAGAIGFALAARLNR